MYDQILTFITSILSWISSWTSHLIQSKNQKLKTVFIFAVTTFVILSLVIFYNYSEKNSKKHEETIAVADVNQKLNLLEINKHPKVAPAPEISGISAWLNSTPKEIKDLKGHVVVLGFWTINCPNCQELISNLKIWNDKYKDQGLEIVAVHLPEQMIEKNTDYVKAELEKQHIQFPVALDNQSTTWKSYANKKKPALYLIDKEGVIRKLFFKNNQYDEVEVAIVDLLNE